MWLLIYTAHQNTHSIFHRPWYLGPSTLHILMHIHHQPIWQHGKVFDKRKMKRCCLKLHWPWNCAFEAAKLTGFKLNYALPIYVEKYFKNCVQIKFLWQEVQNISPLFSRPKLAFIEHPQQIIRPSNFDEHSERGRARPRDKTRVVISAINTPNRSINWQTRLKTIDNFDLGLLNEN